ncbi:hypothetical protein BST22_26080 [Mycolicibacterium chubuense]|uniref:ARB-07466-like C-terminal domain-containing protein n=1 Tax=Mycolicibacterium chubuense TaxID=1800 RepID=A0A0J6WIR0_MYCCU|nr:hypothetical protein [Mycolicibacterium chubuense]KMO83190.1 hypothetical protein MCHUDSM44219_01449 [Mycolicibacterium chubuense]ORA43761.1 hypothetical protein BST22_26080 [Mycolicibacterium chubuense]SPX95969.1 putative secreted protein [Mycolicibacterium chubuense]
MGRHRLATPRRRRWSAPAAAVALPALALVSIGADSLSATTHDAPSGCCAELIAEPPAATQYRTTPADDGLLLAASRSMHRDLETALPPTVGSEAGLQVKTILVARAVSAIFPEVQSIGGVRPDYLRWHPDGLAIDVMIPDHRSPDGITLGDAVLAFVLRNADRLGVAHVIWRQTMYPAHGAPHRMSDLGSDTANHYDHVHIATVGGGYPDGHGLYLG